MTTNQIRKLKRLVRAFPESEIRDLAKTLRVRQRAVLNACEDEGLNINTGFRVGNGIADYDHIGDYTVEDLTSHSDPAPAPAPHSK